MLNALAVSNLSTTQVGNLTATAINEMSVTQAQGFTAGQLVIAHYIRVERIDFDRASRLGPNDPGWQLTSTQLSGLGTALVTALANLSSGTAWRPELGAGAVA